jgi:glycosyltransferase involved in cell wall biosynthesis
MVTIISIFDRHEDFIKLQYNSIKKYVRGNYEYIVFNNASTNDQSKRNEVVCEELGIKNIKISVNYNTQPSYIAGNALNESFKYLNKKYVFKIDSDMFFINDFNVDELFNHDLFYIPTYQPDKVLMWSGVFGINTQKIDLNLDFRPHVIHGTDTFGQSSLLTNDDKYTKKHFNLFMIYDVVGNVISGGLNNDCVVEFDGDDIIITQ